MRLNLSIHPDVRERIDYQSFQGEDEYSREEVDELVEMIVDVLRMPDTAVLRINGNEMPAVLVKEHYYRIRRDHIDYVRWTMRNNSKKVNNIRAYMLTALYNSCFRRWRMIAEKFLKKVVLPLSGAALLAYIFYPFCTEGGETNWLLFIWLMGVPFGITHMFMFVVPRSHPFTDTVGILFGNILIGGVIGIFILAWQILGAVFCLICMIIQTIAGCLVFIIEKARMARA